MDIFSAQKIKVGGLEIYQEQVFVPRSSWWWDSLPFILGPVLLWTLSQSSECGIPTWYKSNKLFDDWIILSQIKISAIEISHSWNQKTVYCQPISTIKPSLSMKLFSINNFTIKLPSKLLSDLSTGVY